MRTLFLFTILIGLATGFNQTDVSAVEPVDFQKQVQPILKRHCDRCHGDSNQEGSLALNRKTSLLDVADSGQAIVVPGKPNQSLLIKRISDADAGDLMPIDGEPLSDREINLLKRWISEGAEIPDSIDGDHWAYIAPTIDHQLLESAAREKLSPIDFLIRRQLSQAGLRPSHRADPSVLARRLSLVLTGLPASLEQMNSLADDPSDENYERLIDELLASDAFGVHWARHWLDLARYADSNGFQADQLRDSWAYRDWVVKALNSDMPFDRFVIEQLAGDLLPDANQQSRIATGFHRTPTCNVEAGVDPEANRVNQVFDRVNTTATVFLGTTLECAQCHEHKYDPFTQEDYYRLFAYFNNTPLEVSQTAGVTYDFIGPTMDLDLPPTQQSARERLIAEIEQLKTDRLALASEQRFDRWRRTMTQSLSQGRATWQTPPFDFSTSADEDYEILEDGSVLLHGSLPGTTDYRFVFPPFGQTVSGIRIDALRHDDLPGGGPGRGDPERTNFVLNEVSVTVESSSQPRSVKLGRAQASFSQANYGVAGAIDGDRKTAWAIAPKFRQEHWATFLFEDAVTLADDQRIAVSLDQHFGRNRVIGRPKVSLLVGPPETASLTDSIAELLLKKKPLTPKQWKQLKKYHGDHDPEISRLDRKIEKLSDQLDQIKPPTTLVMVEQDQERETFVMLRGDYQSKGAKVQPGTPAALHALSNAAPPNRLGLAQWMVDPANPLLARVTVNRFWSELFGRGIVSTAEDFGTQSEPPSHPQLLDYLAVRFQQQQWSIKTILKEIVSSETFRQSSRVDEAALRIDPQNRLLCRGPRFRLPAETIRDNALSVAGLLCEDQDGPPIMPYQPSNIWRAVGRNQPKWQAESDRNRFRRGLYVVWKRGAPYPSFVTFDAPDRASCTVNRARTNTPLQALVLMNDWVYAEASIALAARILRQNHRQDNADSTSPAAMIRQGYKIATARNPSQRTTEMLVQLYQTERQRMIESPMDAKQRIDVMPKTLQNSISGIDRTELAAWYAVASVILNLDQTITLN